MPRGPRRGRAREIALGGLLLAAVLAPWSGALAGETDVGAILRTNRDSLLGPASGGGPWYIHSRAEATPGAGKGGAEGRFLLEVTSGSNGDMMLRREDGTTVYEAGIRDGAPWRRNATDGAVVAAPADRKAALRLLEFHANAAFPGQRFDHIRLAGRAAFHGCDCLRLTMVDKAGRPAFAYFDQAHGRLHGLQLSDGTEPVDMAFFDWRKVGAGSLFAQANLWRGGVLSVYRFAALDLNAMQPGMFRIPERGMFGPPHN